MFQQQSLTIVITAITISVACNLFVNVVAIPKYETNSKTYADNSNEWSRSSFFNENRTHNYEEDNASTKDRLQRLGYPTGYGSLNGYTGSTGVSTYNPIKLDLGGVVLGTLVGIGAIIIIPKILSALQGGYSGYGRSEADDDFLTFSNLVNRIDNVLSQNNIDATMCMQRAVCNYVRSTEYSLKMGASDQMDDLIHMLADNSLVNYLLSGTAIKEALEHGKRINSQPCNDLYKTCQLDNKTLSNLLMKLLPKKPNTQ